MSGHLHSFGLENFRVFDEMTQFEFAPITFLVGPNSSGKSSLIKALLLLRESTRKEKLFEKLNFNTGSHNLGTYENVLSKSGSEEHIRYKIPFRMPYSEDDLMVLLTYAKRNEGGVLSSIILTNNGDHLLTYSTVDDHSEMRFIINVKVDLAFFKSKLDHMIFFNEKANENEYEKGSREENLEELLSNQNAINKKLNELVRHNNSVFNSFYSKTSIWTETDRPKIVEIQPNLFEYDGSMSSEAREIFENSVFKWMLSKGISTEISRDSYDPYMPRTAGERIAYIIGDVEPIGRIVLNQLEMDDDLIFDASPYGEMLLRTMIGEGVEKGLLLQTRLFSRIYSLSSSRGSSDRLLKNSSHESEINDLLIQYSELSPVSIVNVYDFVYEAERLFNLGDTFTVQRIQGVASQILVRTKDGDTAIADLGFGISQLIPIIIKIVLISVENEVKDSEGLRPSYHPSILLLEEPESNLHPNFQSKLADLLIMAGERFNIQFIIETHSEYLIRKMQYHIAKGRIKPQDANIYYFNHPDKRKRPNGEGPVRKIEFEADGRLTREFGSGFFDEADNIALELFVMSKGNKN